MKRCPACNTTYSDPTQRFCLADGNLLIESETEQPTVIRPGDSPNDEETIAMTRRGQMRVEIPNPQAQPTFQQPSRASGGSSGGLMKVLLILMGFGVFIVLLIFAGAIVYYFANQPETVSNGNNNGVSNRDAKTSVSPTPSLTPDDRDDLRNQIANLEKLIRDQKKNPQGSNVPLTVPNQSVSTISARVNSPGDGFLALRTLPNSEAGERILKIPHGALVSIGACGPVVRPVSRSGRWCQAKYNGYSGWVFDAYLSY